MLAGLLTGLHSQISVQDLGLTGKTQADGLAVGRASGFVGKTMEHFISGVLTVDDEKMCIRDRHITMPLVRPSRNSIILLSFLSGMRCFDLIWAMTGGGPGFATDVMASVVYKQYAAGYYGLSTAGNVIMFVMIALIVFPLQRFLLKREEEMA